MSFQEKSKLQIPNGKLGQYQKMKELRAAGTRNTKDTVTLDIKIAIYHNQNFLRSRTCL